jgi:hypothetical protein
MSLEPALAALGSLSQKQASHRVEISAHKEVGSLLWKKRRLALDLSHWTTTPPSHCVESIEDVANSRDLPVSIDGR